MVATYAIVATRAIYIPSSLAVYGAVRWWHARNDSPWRGALERGLAPVAVGLVFAGAVAVMQAAHVNALQIFTTLLAAGFGQFAAVAGVVVAEDAPTTRLAPRCRRVRSLTTPRHPPPPSHRRRATSR